VVINCTDSDSYSENHTLPEAASKTFASHGSLIVRDRLCDFHTRQRCSEARPSWPAEIQVEIESELSDQIRFLAGFKNRLKSSEFATSLVRLHFGHIREVLAN
jgi:hypothetical protein